VGSYRTKSGNIRMSLDIIARRTGYSKNRVSDLGRQVAARADAPFGWDTTREWKTKWDGTEGWVTTLEIEPRAQTTAEALRAIAKLQALPAKPKHGGSQQASDARERARRGCDHEDAAVIVNGCCAEGGEDLGDLRVTAQEWESLKHQLGVSEPPAPVNVVLRGHQVGVSEPPTPLSWLEEWPDGSSPQIALPGTPAELLCPEHGLRFLTSKPGRCSMCVTPPAAPIAPRPPADPRCVRIGCKSRCGPGDNLLCIEHRAEVSEPLAVAGGEE
jgi:hypothetical protein